MRSPEWECSSLYQAKNATQKARASSYDSKRSGNSGRYLSVLNWLSENGLSLETWGRLCDLMIPKAASSWATVCDFMDGPRSEWMVSCSGCTSCLAQDSRMNLVAK